MYMHVRISTNKKVSYYFRFCSTCTTVEKTATKLLELFLLVNSLCACAARVTALGLFVCLSFRVSVTQHLTFQVIQMILTISAVDEGQRFSLKMLCCRAIVFPVGLPEPLLLRRKHAEKMHESHLFCEFCNWQ